MEGIIKIPARPLTDAEFKDLTKKVKEGALGASLSFYTLSKYYKNFGMTSSSAARGFLNAVQSEVSNSLSDRVYKRLDLPPGTAYTTRYVTVGANWGGGSYDYQAIRPQDVGPEVHYAIGKMMESAGWVDMLTRMSVFVGYCVRCNNKYQIHGLTGAAKDVPTKFQRWYLRDQNLPLDILNGLMAHLGIMGGGAAAMNCAMGMSRMLGICHKCQPNCTQCNAPLPETLPNELAILLLTNSGCLVCANSMLVNVTPPKPDRRELKSFRTRFTLKQ